MKSIINTNIITAGSIGGSKLSYQQLIFNTKIISSTCNVPLVDAARLAGFRPDSCLYLAWVCCKLHSPTLASTVRRLPCFESSEIRRNLRFTAHSTSGNTNKNKPNVHFYLSFSYHYRK